MRGGDVRGRRLAIVGHDLMNAHLGDDPAAADALAALEELGIGLMALPPAGLAALASADAIGQLVDQLQDYLRHGYAAVLVETPEAAEALALVEEALCRRGLAPLVRVRADADFRQSIETAGAVSG